MRKMVFIYFYFIILLFLSPFAFSAPNGDQEFGGGVVEYICPPDELVAKSRGFFDFTHNNFKTSWYRPLGNYDNSTPVKFIRAQLTFNYDSNNYKIECIYSSENAASTWVDIDIYENHKVAGKIPGRWDDNPSSHNTECSINFNDDNKNISQSECRFLLMKEIACPWCKLPMS